MNKNYILNYNNEEQLLTFTVDDKNIRQLKQFLPFLSEWRVGKAFNEIEADFKYLLIQKKPTQSTPTVDLEVSEVGGTYSLNFKMEDKTFCFECQKIDTPSIPEPVDTVNSYIIRDVIGNVLQVEMTDEQARKLKAHKGDYLTIEEFSEPIGLIGKTKGKILQVVFRNSNESAYKQAVINNLDLQENKFKPVGLYGTPFFYFSKFIYKNFE